MLGLAAGIGAHQAEDVIGELGVGGPDLGSVQNVILTVLDRRQLEAGQVGPGPGLGIALAPVVLSGKHPGQVVRFLLIGAVPEEHRREHAQPQGISPGAPAFAISSPKMYFRVGDQPGPPCSSGHEGTAQPFSTRTFCQGHGQVPVGEYSGGARGSLAHRRRQFSSRKSRTSWRNPSSSLLNAKSMSDRLFSSRFGHALIPFPRQTVKFACFEQLRESDATPDPGRMERSGFPALVPWPRV